MNPNKEVSALFAHLGESAKISFKGIAVADVRKMYQSVGEQFGGQSEKMEEVINEIVPSKPDIPIRIYKPYKMHTKNGLAPVFIYVHGGGWAIGSIETHDKVCRHIAQQSQYMVLSVEYRLTPENRMPAGSNDAIEVLKYVYKNGQQWGIDTSNIAIGGDSAGGSISAVVSIAARDENIPLKGVVLFYPSTDTRTDSDYPSYKGNAQNPPLTWDNYQWFIEQTIHDKSQTLDWKISPITATSLKDIAPTLIFVGGADVLHDEGRAYAERLSKDGVDVILHDIPGMVHGFIEMYGVLSTTKFAMQETSTFLDFCFDIY